jgi:hypothetical protein
MVILIIGAVPTFAKADQQKELEARSTSSLKPLAGIRDLANRLTDSTIILRP